MIRHADTVVRIEKFHADILLKPDSKQADIAKHMIQSRSGSTDDCDLRSTSSDRLADCKLRVRIILHRI